MKKSNLDYKSGSLAHQYKPVKRRRPYPPGILHSDYCPLLATALSKSCYKSC